MEKIDRFAICRKREKEKERERRILSSDRSDGFWRVLKGKQSKESYNFYLTEEKREVENLFFNSNPFFCNNNKKYKEK